MKLRKAVLSDITEITELWKDMMDFHQGQDGYYTLDENAKRSYQKYVEENIRNKSKYLKVCLDDKNELIGYLFADIYEYPPIYPVKKYIEINEMVVRKDQRRKGIGKIMLQDVLDWAKEKGITRVECKVATLNPISQGFWNKNRFRAYMENRVLEI